MKTTQKIDRNGSKVDETLEESPLKLLKIDFGDFTWKVGQKNTQLSEIRPSSYQVVALQCLTESLHRAALRFPSCILLQQLLSSSVLHWHYQDPKNLPDWACRYCGIHVALACLLRKSHVCVCL